LDDTEQWTRQPRRRLSRTPEEEEQVITTTTIAMPTVTPTVGSAPVNIVGGVLVYLLLFAFLAGGAGFVGFFVGLITRRKMLTIVSGIVAAVSPAIAILIGVLALFL
jgi:hypothetical protein